MDKVKEAIIRCALIGLRDVKTIEECAEIIAYASVAYSEIERVRRFIPKNGKTIAKYVINKEGKSVCKH